MISISVLLVGAAITGAIALTAHEFSSTAFVSRYMTALARRDVASALSMPGVVPAGQDPVRFAKSSAATLLTPAALPGSNAHATFSISRDELVPGDPASGSPETHRITVLSSLARNSLTFTVAHTGSVAGLFTQWAFVDSPLATLHVTTEHATFFSVNNFGPIDIVALDPAANPNDFTAEFDFTVLAPSSYTLKIDSQALTSDPVTVDVVPGESETSATNSATVTANPTAGFTARVQKEVETFFDGCVAQKVLLPSGCPFGVRIDNRVVGEPSWSVVSYPTVSLVVGEAGWQIAPAPMTLHFVADIQSLFDGSVTTVSEDMPINVGGQVGLSASGDISVIITRAD